MTKSLRVYMDAAMWAACEVLRRENDHNWLHASPICPWQRQEHHSMVAGMHERFAWNCCSSPMHTHTFQQPTAPQPLAHVSRGDRTALFHLPCPTLPLALGMGDTPPYPLGSCGCTANTVMHHKEPKPLLPGCCPGRAGTSVPAGL